MNYHNKFVLAGVFALINAYAFIKYIQNFLTKAEFRHFFIAAVTAAAAVVFVAVVGLTWAGVYEHKNDRVLRKLHLAQIYVDHHPYRHLVQFY